LNFEKLGTISALILGGGAITVQQQQQQKLQKYEKQVEFCVRKLSLQKLEI
jgi:hypothetical protein